jgi:hypothetical protein
MTCLTTHFNADAGKRLVEYESRALGLCRVTADRVAATREIVAHSEVLIAELDTLLATGAFRMGWLRPLGGDPTASARGGHPERCHLQE